MFTSVSGPQAAPLFLFTEAELEPSRKTTNRNTEISVPSSSPVLLCTVVDTASVLGWPLSMELKMCPTMWLRSPGARYGTGQPVMYVVGGLPYVEEVSIFNCGACDWPVDEALPQDVAFQMDGLGTTLRLNNRWQPWCR